MQGYSTDIEQDTLANTNFRQVLYTGKYMQLVLMAIKPGEEIGLETHESVDQFFRVEQGELVFIVNGEETVVGDGGAYIVPAGSEHNVVNRGEEEAKLYTIYAPPNHPDGTVHATKAEADEYEAQEHH